MFYNNIVKISEKLNKWNLLKIWPQVIYPIDFCMIWLHFYYGKKWKYLIFLKTKNYNNLFFHTTNGFALNHDKNLQIYYFCVKCQGKNDFLKDVESTVEGDYYVIIIFIISASKHTFWYKEDWIHLIDFLQFFFLQKTTSVTSCLHPCTPNM